MEIRNNSLKKYHRFNKRYIFVPFVSVIGYIIFLFFYKNINFASTETLASISATFSGFLITAVSIVITLNNEFTKIFKKSILYKDIRITFFITIGIFIILTFLFSVGIINSFVEILFIISLTETIVLVIYLYEISRESTK
ncbi:hypothetical protein [Peptostreptococcus porci]|uniref:hypothetical protein n=1 Tax=Peptostreptococcus porci TaxID=2652282 RepID=UPI002A82A788|nr:hypothetical protein [Peptostreptococcus porci]MDY4129201.1 hypothetical protein [Peptostreptococcus porci]MDY5436522.1 hypothetical protein [Peptostreptococcus porci]MDY6231049.1 hypothetical protein [Peptostreptococcus porci]